MDYYHASLSYDDLLRDLKDALDRVLSGQVLSPMCMSFDIKMTLALLDVAHAVRHGRPTQQLVIRACEQFAYCAVNVGASGHSRRSTVPASALGRHGAGGLAERSEFRRPDLLQSTVAETE